MFSLSFGAYDLEVEQVFFCFSGLRFWVQSPRLGAESAFNEAFNGVPIPGPFPPFPERSASAR